MNFDKGKDIPQVYAQHIDVAQLKQNGLPAAPGSKDIPFAILWILNLIAFIALSSYGGVKFGEMQDKMNTGELEAPSTVQQVDVSRLLMALIGTFVAAILISTFWLFLATRWPRKLIIFSIVGKILLWAAATVGCFIAISSYNNDPNNQPVSLAFCGIPAFFGLISVCIYFLWRRRIPFAATILQTVATVIRAHPGAAVGSFVSLFVLIIWSIGFGYGSYVTGNGLQLEGGAAYALWVYLTFCFYWNQQVIRNVFHTTSCGVMASFYFLGGNNGAMPSNPSVKAFKRATTTSFGSICFGSMLVALIQTARAIVRSFKSNRNVILKLVAECLLGCLEAMARYFNAYAYTLVAIYGMSFCDAAKQTFGLIGSHGIMAIANDMIIDAVITLACFMSAIFSGLVGFGVGYLLFPNDQGFVIAIVAIGGILFGFIAMSQMSQAIDSCVKTLFVCYAMDPQALADVDVALAQEFQAHANLV